MAKFTQARILTELEEKGSEAGKRAMVSAMAETAAAIQASPLMPVNLGTLRMNVVAEDVVEQPSRLTCRIVVTGLASAYGVVMSLGRRPGARGPSWRMLFFAPGQTGRDAWRGGWVNRKLRGAVVQLANEILAKLKSSARYRSMGTWEIRKKKPQDVSRGTAERQACFILARAIARSIHARGMKGKGFVRQARADLPERFRAAYFAELEAAGVTGGGK